MDIDKQSIIFGRRAVVSTLEKTPKRVEHLWVQNSRVESLTMMTAIKLARSAGIRVTFVDRKIMDKLAEGGVHQGLIARVAECEFIDLDDWFLIDHSKQKSQVVCILDRVQDPRNLGAIFRSCFAADVSAIILPMHHSAPISSITEKASAGTIGQIPAIRVGNLANTLRRLKEEGFWIIGVSHDADTPIWTGKYPDKIGLVFGGEGQGLRPAQRKECDEMRMIPMNRESISLNVSVAVAIALYELIRQGLVFHE